MFLFVIKTLEAIKRKQFKKYHEAKDEDKKGIELNPYTIFHQALKNCEPVIGISRVIKAGKIYQVSHKKDLRMRLEMGMNVCLVV